MNEPDLSTDHMGLDLKHPFIAGASPLSAHLDNLKRLEDAGASAVVLPSLFEEQITETTTGRIHGVDRFDDPPLAAHGYEAFPSLDDYALSPDAYLDHLRRAKAAMAIPIIASLSEYRRWRLAAPPRSEGAPGCWRRWARGQLLQRRR